MLFKLGFCVPISSSKKNLISCWWKNSWNEFKTRFLKNRPSPASFSFIFVRSNKHYNSYNKYMWKNQMSIYSMALGFEPTTFGTHVSSQNHQTRAPTQKQVWANLFNLKTFLDGPMPFVCLLLVKAIVNLWSLTRVSGRDYLLDIGQNICVVTFFSMRQQFLHSKLVI